MTAMVPAALIWLAAGLLLLALEWMGAEFDGLLAAALSALVVSAASALAPWPPLLQVAIFAALCALLLLALRRWERRSRERALPASSRSQRAEVIEGFGHSPEGRVRWQGQSWAATCLSGSAELPPGTAMTVMGRDGNQLQVLPEAAGATAVPPAAGH